MPNKYLIYGGSGGIGSVIARRLHAKGCQLPIPRLGEAEDIAALADFLLSGESSWITGQILGVDGGRSTLRNKS